MDGSKLDDWLLSPWAFLEEPTDQTSRRKARTERASNDGDTINGTGEDDIFFGGRGDDLLRGRGGNDRLIGKAGEDRLFGGGGNDSIVGSAGADFIKGGGGADTIKGGGKADDIRGGGGADSLLGGGGIDTLNGGGADDFIDGGGGADILFGNRGSDTLKGGRGADIFQFAARDLSNGAIDTITDLGRGDDLIDISRFSGIAAISQLQFGMLDGDLTIDIGAGRIRLQGVTSADQLSADQFIFDPAAELPTTPPTEPPVEPPVTPPVEPPVTPPPVDPPVTPPPPPPNENDVRVGGSSADVIPTEVGVDTLIGNGGADVFDIRLEGGALDVDPDRVADFDYVGGDRIGLNAALTGVSFGTIDEVVRLDIVGDNTEVAINRGGGFETALVLEGVQFTLPEIASYGFELAPRASTGFVENPYGFENNNAALADPDATRDGLIVAFVDQTNVDNAPDDFSINSGLDEINADLDIFVRNTATGVTIRASADGNGNTLKAQGGLGATSHSPSLSADGRWIAFATDGVGAANDLNNQHDIYVRDLANDGAPILVTVGEDGLAAGGVAQPFFAADSSAVVALSGDGRKVAFVSTATFGVTFIDDFDGETVTADTNNLPDVYLKDLDTGEVTLISKLDGFAVGATPPYEGSDLGDIVSISEDGRYVAYLTSRSIDESGDNNGLTDVYLYDSVRDLNLVVSSFLLPNGFSFGGDVFGFDMSASGDRIAFLTDVAFDADDTNDLLDVYVADIDLETFQVTDRFRVSEAPGGLQIETGEAKGPVISPDGQRVAWATQAEDVAFFDPFEINENGERIFVNDLSTGEIQTVAGQTAQNGFLDSDYAVFTDDGFIYRKEVPAAPGGNRTVSETLSSEPLVPVEPVEIASVDVPGADQLFLSSRIRSSIEAPGDIDLFRLFPGDRLVNFSVEGVSNNGGTLPNPVLKIYVSEVDGFPEFSSPEFPTLDDRDSANGDLDPFLPFDTGGEQLFLEVSGFNGATGTYTLEIELI